jgi:hypothetical protein
MYLQSGETHSCYHPKPHKIPLAELKDKVVDQRTQIKLNELVSIIKPIDKSDSVKDEDILNLLQFHELVHEIKTL